MLDGVVTALGWADDTCERERNWRSRPVPSEIAFVRLQGVMASSRDNVARNSLSLFSLLPRQEINFRSYPRSLGLTIPGDDGLK